MKSFARKLFQELPFIFLAAVTAAIFAQAPILPAGAAASIAAPVSPFRGAP